MCSEHCSVVEHPRLSLLDIILNIPLLYITGLVYESRQQYGCAAAAYNSAVRDKIPYIFALDIAVRSVVCRRKCYDNMIEVRHV